MLEKELRAWDKVNRRMLKSCEFDLHYKGDCYRNEYGDLHIPMGNPSNYELMDYTTLKDKNNKKIFEGDIVNVHMPHGDCRMLVCNGIYDNKDWNPEDLERGLGFYLHQISVDSGDYGNGLIDNYVWNILVHYTKNFGSQYEIIGNIYEDPELLQC